MADRVLQELKVALRAMRVRRVAAPKPRAGTFVDVGA
jgi:hypothetical protein